MDDQGIMDQFPAEARGISIVGSTEPLIQQITRPVSMGVKQQKH
jgi:hypothetical protein